MTDQINKVEFPKPRSRHYIRAIVDTKVSPEDLEKLQQTGHCRVLIQVEVKKDPGDNIRTWGEFQVLAEGNDAATASEDQARASNET